MCDQMTTEKIEKPTLTFHEGLFTMEQVLDEFGLPAVVQSDSSSICRLSKSNIDIHQPFILYRRRDVVKMEATSLIVDAENTCYGLEDIFIPEDYTGWFAVLNHKTRNMPVPHYRQVAQLAQSDCYTFLIGGSDCVQAVQKLNKDSPPVPRVLYPGDELKMGNMYVAKTKVKNSLFSKPQKKEEKFLLCTDQNDREVLLPLESTGMFYIVRNKSKAVHVPVRQIKDIISNTKLPCEVKLIFGRLPTTPCSFTGMLLLKNAYPESSAVASSIVNLRNILLEIPSDIPMKFKVAVTDSALLDNKGFKDAVRLCQEKAETYMRNIKVSQLSQATTEEAPSQREQTLHSNSSSLTQTHTTSIPVNQLPSVPAKTIPKSINTKDLHLPSQLGDPISGGGVPLVPPKSNSPHPLQSPLQTPVVPPVPTRVPARARSESTGSSLASNSPPKPPPQSSKPSHLDRVVCQGSAPPLVRFDQKDGTANCRKAAKGCQYEKVWPACKPSQEIPPTPPPKCFPSTSNGNAQFKRQKSITISMNNGYLTVPAYPIGTSENSNPDEELSVADKVNFWKRLDETSLAVARSASSKADDALARTGSVTYSECGISGNNVGTYDETGKQGQGSTGAIYENIEDLRQFRMEVKNQNVYETPVISDDIVYEPVDDLPAGASANRFSCADSGIAVGAEDEADDICPGVSELSVGEVFEKLKEVGVNKKTRDFLKKEKVDGRLLTAFDETTLKTTFPSISNIDIKKIGLFARGWRPK